MFVNIGDEKIFYIKSEIDYEIFIIFSYFKYWFLNIFFGLGFGWLMIVFVDLLLVVWWCLDYLNVLLVLKRVYIEYLNNF